MRKGVRHAVLAVGAALVIGAAPGMAVAAAPLNCGDINGDGQITSADLSALQAGTISPACAATSCADINGAGLVGDAGDQAALNRFLAGGGTIGQPGRAKGEQNLLYKLCEGEAPALPCNTAGQPLTGRFTNNITIPGPGDNPPCSEFFISGRVTMANNTTLTVHPGAVVKALPVSGGSEPSLILITRGSHLNANGQTNPIIFTSAKPVGTRAAGDWGGLIFNGFAPENIVGEGSSEGLPPGDDTKFGGDNPNAFTYQLIFVRVEFSGFVLGDANELNILTQNSVGRLSRLDHVQTNVGKDDCFEWFGGNVRGKFLVASGCGDDGLDWQLGYQGLPDPATPAVPAVQFALVADDHFTTASDPDSHGIEADNSEFGFDLQPRCAPYFCNVTLVGPNDTPAGTFPSTGDGARLRRGTAGKIENSIIENWPSNTV